MEVTKVLEAALGEMKPVFEKEGITLYPRLHRPATFIEAALRNMKHSLVTSRPATRTSRWTRFLAVLPSGTRWKYSRGPYPAGSMRAHWSPNSSSDIPMDLKNSSREVNPSGSGWVM